MTEFSYRQTVFSYRQVVNGLEELLPDLAKHMNMLFPKHQLIFHQILTAFGLFGWKVIFSPTRNFFNYPGALLTPLKVIIIGNHLDRKEIIVTFYHEIIHQLFPITGDVRFNEDQVEEMAYQWYEEDYYQLVKFSGISHAVSG